MWLSPADTVSKVLARSLYLCNQVDSIIMPRVTIARQGAMTSLGRGVVQVLEFHVHGGVHGTLCTHRFSHRQYQFASGRSSFHLLLHRSSSKTLSPDRGRLASSPGQPSL